MSAGLCNGKVMSPVSFRVRILTVFIKTIQFGT